MPRNSDPNSATSNVTVTVNKMIYYLFRNSGGSLSEIADIAMDAFLHAPSERLIELEKELARGKAVYDAVEKMLLEKAEMAEAEKAEMVKALEKESSDKNKVAEYVLNGLNNLPEKTREKFIRDYDSGNFDGVVDNVIMSFQKRLSYSYNEIVDALNFLSKSRWVMP